MPEDRASFSDVRLVDGARAIALVLHGGAQHGDRRVGGSSLAWQRGRFLMRAVAPELARDKVATVLLRYRVKGWNALPGSVPDPVRDARWALDELAREHGLPVAILGHSMGARTGVAVADHPLVSGVVALAPWLPPEDPVAPLSGKALRAAHGRRDKITSHAATRAFVDRARTVADATFTDMGQAGHYLLRDASRWNAVAVAGVRELLREV